MTRLLSRVLAAGCILLSLAGCVGARAVVQDRGAGDLGYLHGSGVLRLVAPRDRHPVKSFAGPLLNGGHFDLSSLHGRVVVVNFWGSWCGDCRKEAPYLAAVYDATKAKGVEFVGVDVRDHDENARAYVETHHIDYPVVVDRNALLALRFRDLPPQAVPTTVFIDRDGREAGRIVGPVLYSRLIATVRALEAEPV